LSGASNTAGPSTAMATSFPSPPMYVIRAVSSSLQPSPASRIAPSASPANVPVTASDPSLSIRMNSSPGCAS